MNTNFPGFHLGIVTFSCAMGNSLGKPCISHIMKYTTKWGSNGKNHPHYGKSMGTNFPGFAHLMVFAEFSDAIANWLQNSNISHLMKSTIGWESNGKKAPIYGKSMNTSFPGFCHTTGFVAFSHTIGNWWENQYIFHMMKYTIGWELDGKKAPILWEKYEYQFPRSSPYDGFVAFSRTMGNWSENPCIYHMMKYIIGWESDGKKVPILW